MFNFTVMVLLAMLLAGCGRETPEEAKDKLEKMKVQQSPEALLASTKTEKSEKVAELLVAAGVDPNAHQKNGMTVLMSAVFNGQEDVVKVLLEKGADVKLNAAGYNALSLSVERGNKAIVKMLLAAGADPKDASNFRVVFWSGALEYDSERNLGATRVGAVREALARRTDGPYRMRIIA